MTQRGLTDTEPVTNDGRGTEVTATTRGKAAFRDARQGHVELVQELFFHGLPEDALGPLGETLEHVYANIVERGRGIAAQRTELSFDKTTALEGLPGPSLGLNRIAGLVRTRGWPHRHWASPGISRHTSPAGHLPR